MWSGPRRKGGRGSFDAGNARPMAMLHPALNHVHGLYKRHRQLALQISYWQACYLANKGAAGIDWDWRVPPLEFADSRAS